EGHPNHTSAATYERVLLRPPGVKTRKAHNNIPYGQKIRTARRVGQLPQSAWSRRELSATFFGAINGAHCEPAGKGGAHGHVSWPTSAGPWTRSCCCGMNISPLRTRF